jgi:thiamine pyrophosphate-dependent acetolactate synthase large subunit-like protein
LELQKEVTQEAVALFEQHELGNPAYGCDFSPIDFARFAKNRGAAGFRCTEPAEVASAIRLTLQSPGPAVLEASVDANEKPSLPEELKL